MFQRTIAALLITLFTVPLLGAEDKKKPTRAEAAALARAFVDSQRAYDEIPGMSFAVVHDQELLWSGGSGMADPATGRPATDETLYSICSVSKLFTAIAVMQQRDAGKLALSDPVAKHLPWFTIPSGPEGGVVTVENILTHSSGLPRESDFPYWSGRFEFPTREQVVERLRSQTMLYPSDTYFQYSNLGLTLAGEIAAAAAGKPYEQYVRERILQPMGLSSTYPEIPGEESGKRLAVGHSARRRDGTRAVLPLFSTRGIAPAAGFASTARDLARFASWQFRTLAGQDRSILEPRTLREMQRVHWVEPDFKTYWGLGFAVNRSDDETLVGHGGSCPGFRTNLVLDPADKIGVAVMANASGVQTQDYARVLRQIFEPVAEQKEPGSINPALDPYIGSYSDFPWDGETIFLSWGGELASISLPSMTAVKDMDRYRQVGPHQFRRVRKDDSMAETITFELGPDGKATGYRVHSNVWPRMAVR